MSDHTIMIIWRFFLYSSSVCSWHLLLISSASVRSTPFLSFIVPSFAWNIPLVSLIFLKRSLLFPILLFSSISLGWSEEGFVISPCYSLELCIQMGISFLFSFSFSFSSFLSQFISPPQATGEGTGNPLQCSCLENPMDGGAWSAAVYGVAKSRTWLKRLSSSGSLMLRVKKDKVFWKSGCWRGWFAPFLSHSFLQGSAWVSFFQEASQDLQGGAFLWASSANCDDYIATFPKLHFNSYWEAMDVHI